MKSCLAGGRRVRPANSAIRRALAASLILMLTTSLAVFAEASSASASGICSSSGKFNDGYFYNPNAFPGYDFEGASGYIVVRDGNLCVPNSGPQNFTNAWVMIASDPSGNSGSGWSQVGFERTAGYNLRWFAQHAGRVGNYFDITTRYSTFSVNNQVGVRHTFRVLWNYSCYCIRATIDTTNWLDSKFNPFVDTTWTRPFSPQFAGEAGYRESDMPGLSSARTAFSALGAQRYSDDVLAPLPCIMSGANDNPARWGRLASSCEAFTIWTQVLS
jgi:hypothetical protein